MRRRELLLLLAGATTAPRALRGTYLSSGPREKLPRTRARAMAGTNDRISVKSFLVFGLIGGAYVGRGPRPCAWDDAGACDRGCAGEHQRGHEPGRAPAPLRRYPRLSFEPSRRRGPRRAPVG